MMNLLQNSYRINRIIRIILLTSILCFLSSYADSSTSDKNILLQNIYKLSPYNLNELLPAYYNQHPYSSSTNTQQSKNLEIKFQFSLKFPIYINQTAQVEKTGLFIAYTQKSYWQRYLPYPFFRETNYNPNIFMFYKYKSFFFQNGYQHQSNGVGDQFERKWNRLYFAGGWVNSWFLLKIETWILPLVDKEAKLRNPDIEKYLGHEYLMVSQKIFLGTELDLKIQNIEHLRYVNISANYSIPLSQYWHIMIQGHYGYGESLISYNHSTTTLGIGLAYGTIIQQYNHFFNNPV